MWSHYYARYKNPIITNICSWPKLRRHFVHKQDNLFTNWTITWPEFTVLLQQNNYPATMDKCMWPQPLSLQHCKLLPLDLNVSPQHIIASNKCSRYFIPSTEPFTQSAKTLLCQKLNTFHIRFSTTSSIHVTYKVQTVHKVLFPFEYKIQFY
jgi:hypothetical protein